MGSQSIGKAQSYTFDCSSGVKFNMYPNTNVRISYLIHVDKYINGGEGITMQNNVGKTPDDPYKFEIYYIKLIS